MHLAAADLSFAYPSAPHRLVVRSVTATFAPGLTCVIGPNAAGKSTLLRLLLGGLRPTSGRVTLDGRPAADIPPETLARRVAYIPQSATLAAPFTLRQVVALARHAHPSARHSPSPDGAGRDIVGDVLDRLELLGLAQEPFHRLSAGQQQRGRLARAVAQLADSSQPDFADLSSRVLLADEPISAMDPRHALASLSLLRALGEAGCTVIVVLHDLTLCLRFARSVLALSAEGRLHAHAEPGSVLTPDVLRELFSTDFRVLTTSDGPPCPAAVVACPPESVPVRAAH